MVGYLYEQWLGVAREHSSQPAFCNRGEGANSDISYTFSEMAALAEKAPPARRPIHYTQETGLNLVIEVLRAWRDDVPFCAIEPEAKLPPLLTSGEIPPLPAGCVHLKLTSGSTGQPRFVAFRAEQLAADPAQLIPTMGLGPGIPNLAVISAAHSYGFSNLILPLLLHGIPLYWLGSPLPETVRKVLERFAKEGGLAVPAVPAMWRIWEEAGILTAEAIRIAISAGAPLPLKLEQTVFAKSGLKIHNFYGSSECGGIAYDRSVTPREAENFAGQAVDGVRLETDEQGRLTIHSAAAGLGYWPETDHALAGEGRFLTSDLGEVSGAEQCVHLLGRASDLMNLAGRKVAPQEIERHLADHESVGECLVFSISRCESSRGEDAVACVRWRGEGPQGEPERVLRQHLLKQLPVWKVPRHWWFTPELHPDSRGKLSRARWREKFVEYQKSATKAPERSSSGL